MFKTVCMYGREKEEADDKMASFVVKIMNFIIFFSFIVLYLIVQ